MKKLGIIFLIWILAGMTGKTDDGYEVETMIPETEYQTEWGNETEFQEKTEEAEEETWWETEIETENISENIPESETETETEAETESETETETETEEKRLEVRNIRLLDQRGYRYYDGTNKVDLTAEVWNLPEGAILHICGEVSSADVGIYPVTVRCWLEGEMLQSDSIYIEETELIMEIKKKPLNIEISDARKPYYSENSIQNLFFEEEEPLKITGFVTDEEGQEIIPDGFQMPELELDDEKIWKTAPMYADGMEIQYKDAITLAKDDEGNVYGNATENYCFETENSEYCRKGSIVLTQIPIQENVDYQVFSRFGLYRGEDHRIWTIPGDTIYIEPVAGSGFDYGAEFTTVSGEQTEEFSLTEKDGTGEITAVSQIQSITWNVDATSPEGNIIVEGTEKLEENQFTADAAVVVIEGWDQESGIRSIDTCLIRDEESEKTAEDLFQNNRENWGKQKEFRIDSDGRYRIYVRLEDQVGNLKYLVSDRIIVDKRKPDIRIINIGKNSANRGSVMPCIECKDNYLKSDSLSVSLKGAMNGEVKLPFWKEEEDGEVKIQFSDFPVLKEWDDVYDLTVSIKDVAGNRNQQSIRFSVNRFGSTYYIENWNADKYYYQDIPPVTIHEVNVDELVETKIMVGRDEQVRFLEPDQDYTIDVLGNPTGWKEYIYRISPEVFCEEGYYYLVCSSKDQAENFSDNRTQKVNLEFALDRSKPEIFLFGIQNGGEYPEGRKIRIIGIDNLGISSMEVIINGKIIRKSERSEIQMELKPNEDWQEIQVIAKDLAGNQKISDNIRVRICEKEKKKEPGEDRIVEQHKDTLQKEKEIERQTGEEAEENGLLYMIMGVFIIFCGFLKGILWFTKRVKE